MRLLRLVMAAIISIIAVIVPTQAATASSTTVASHLAACAQSGDTISALFVLDRSGSLSGTDPGGTRYEALQIALEQLSQRTPNGGDDLAVEVAVAAFDDAYDSVRDVVRWTRIDSGAFRGDEDAQQRTVTEIVDLAKKRTAPDGGTDFEAALTGALDDMEDRGGPGSCRVVVWFTDGTFDIAGDIDAARARLCQPGGTLDRIRQAGIFIVGIQLAADSRDLLPMSEGLGEDGTTCGTTPIPSDWAPGLYLRADDTAALKRTFGTVVDIVQGCTPADPETKLIDPGIRRFRATIDTPSRATALRLDAPDGTVIMASLDGTTAEDGYEVTTRADDHYVSFEVSLPSGRGIGNWTFTTDPVTTSTNTSLCVFHDLKLALVDTGAEPLAGGISEISVQAIAPDGVAADLSAFATVTVGSAALGADGSIRSSAARIDNGEIVVEVESLPNDRRIDLSLTMELTTESGIQLTPVSARLPITFQLAKEFPVVTPSDVLNLGEAVKTNPASGTFTLMGSPDGPTRVCFEPFTSVIVPDDAEGTVPEISDQCVDLGTGESRDVTVSVTPAAAAEGAGSASLPIVLHGAARPDSPSQELRYEVPIEWRFSNPLNAPVAIVVLVLIAGISLLLPLLAMGLANLASARFEIKGLQVGEVPILVGDGRVTRQVPLAESADRLLDIYRDRDAHTVVTDSRRFTIYGIEFRAKSTLNPFGAPSFTATAPQGTRIMSSVGMPIAGDRKAYASPGLGFMALALATDADLASTAHDVPATLVFMLRDTSAFASDPHLADSLTNKSLLWERISDEWRPDAEHRIQSPDELGPWAPQAPGSPGSNLHDDPYFD